MSEKAKTAEKDQPHQEKAQPVVTPDEMITALRGLLAANVFVGNQTYIKALLSEYDRAQKEIKGLQIESAEWQKQLAVAEAAMTEANDTISFLNGKIGNLIVSMNLGTSGEGPEPPAFAEKPNEETEDNEIVWTNEGKV
jgi:hypothetical protein